jgi:hypothetical protein
MPSAMAPSGAAVHIGRVSLSDSFPLDRPNSEITNFSRSDDTRNTTYFGNKMGMQAQLDIMAEEAEYLKKDVSELGSELQHKRDMHRLKELRWKEEKQKLEVKVQ